MSKAGVVPESEHVRTQVRQEGFVRGWLVNADIAGYSLKTAPVQRDIATYLIRCVQSTHLFRVLLKGSDGYSLVSTGDGFILVVREDVIRPQGGGYQMLRFAEEILHLVRAYERLLVLYATPATSPYDQEFRIRIGLHSGRFIFEEILGQRNAIGTGINLVTRIAGIGDEYCILVSKDFVTQLHLSGTQLPEGVFLTSLREVRVKHNLSIPAFIYYREDKQGHIVSGVNTPPRSVMRQLRIDVLVKEAMADLVSSISDIINIKGGDPQRANVRASVLASSRRERGKGKYLVVSEYRHQLLGKASPSPIAYRIPTDDPDDECKVAEGVAAEAFQTDNLAAATELPDPLERRLDYEAALRKHGLTPEKIAQFGRLALAFIALPITLPISLQDSLVLTIDALDGLFAEGTEPFNDIVARMRQTASRLSLIFEMRHPITIKEEKEE